MVRDRWKPGKDGSLVNQSERRAKCNEGLVAQTLLPVRLVAQTFLSVVSWPTDRNVCATVLRFIPHHDVYRFIAFFSVAFNLRTVSIV